MPFPLLVPIALTAASAAFAALGIKKGVDAYDSMENAKRIGRDAESRYKDQANKLCSRRDIANAELEKLGRLKIDIFTTQIRYLVDAIKKGRSKFQKFDHELDTEQLADYEQLVLESLRVERGIISGTIGGGIAMIGAYGSVGIFASASTGTAISTLSGVAAKNATLAWLGGGALSAGGLGMAGGVATLTGVMLGPALAIGGFILASKAEEALTKAYKYKADTDVAIERLEEVGVNLDAIRNNAEEKFHVIENMVAVFEKVKVPDCSDEIRFSQMIIIGRALKELLDIKILDESGSAVTGLRSRYSGILEIASREVV